MSFFVSSKIRQLAFIFSIALISGYGGWFLGHRDLNIKWANYRPDVTIINRSPPDNRPIDFSLFWGAWNRLEKFYVDKKALDPQKMFYGAIRGMVAALGDPYTVFLDPEQNKRSKEGLGGSFEGIGAQLGVKDNRIIIVAPLKGHPAEAAGVKAGDIIVKVDGQDASSWTLPEAIQNIRGPKGTVVVLTLAREGRDEPFALTIKRDTIIVQSVEYELKSALCQAEFSEGKSKEDESQEPRCRLVESCPSADRDCFFFGYLKLSRFGERTESEWQAAVDQFLSDFALKKGLILDLRNNPGGFLTGSVFIASEFLKDGLVVKQEASSGKSNSFEVDRQGRLTDFPLVVLVNEGAASASEIVAGALQKRGRAQIVGIKTFGKGSVQEAQELPGGAGLHITTARWLLPDDSWINGQGVTPDVIIEDDEKTPEVDEQLEKAVELLMTAN